MRFDREMSENEELSHRTDNSKKNFQSASRGNDVIAYENIEHDDTLKKCQFLFIFFFFFSFLWTWVSQIKRLDWD